ncbi:hypothetical protein [Bifidobacterium sp. wkB338]|uniref:hypothetical protein n=1 Tax=Bifidobacterium sp. wkB338 TaxID=2025114 RepID=UPI001604BA2D|nr:hypothetical protein [Bifidobacterium sp. wkB338]
MDLDEALELLSKETSKIDEYSDKYSPDWPKRVSGKQRGDSFMKWAGIGFFVKLACI